MTTTNPPLSDDDPSPKVSALRSVTIIRLTLVSMMIPLFTSEQLALERRSISR
jgi:hypothetical protein